MSAISLPGLPEAARGVPADATERFATHGSFVTAPLFDLSTLAMVRDEIDRIWATRRAEHDKGPLAAVRPELQRLHRESAALAAFCRHDAFAAIARSLLGADADLFWNQAYVKAPDRGGLTAIPWHQDAYYAPLDRRVYNCWVAVTRTTVANGTLVHVPAPANDALLAHTWDRELEFFRCDVDESAATPIVLEPGQAFVYHGRVPHRSGPNTSDEVRIAYSVAFAAAGVRLAINGEAFGDRVPILRGGARADVALSAWIVGGATDPDHPGARLAAEIATRAPARAEELDALLAAHRDAVSRADDATGAALLSRALALVPHDDEVGGDEIRARTRPDQLFDQYWALLPRDAVGARRLLQRVLELAPGDALARALLARST